MDLTQAMGDSGGGFMDMLGSLFSSGGGGQTTDKQGMGGSTGGLVEQPQQSSSPWWLPILMGGGGMLASKLIGAGDQKNINKMNKNLKSASNSAIGAGNTMVQRGAAGQLTDPQKAAVEQLKARENATMQQRFAQMGIPMSTMQAQASNQVEMDAEAFSQKLINDSFEQGLKALQIGTGASSTLLTSAMKNKSDMAQAIQEMMKETGRVMTAKPGQPGQSASGNVQQQAQTAGNQWPNTWEPDMSGEVLG